MDSTPFYLFPRSPTTPLLTVVYKRPFGTTIFVGGGEIGPAKPRVIFHVSIPTLDLKKRWRKVAMLSRQ